jgi:hypothetical protein
MPVVYVANTIAKNAIKKLITVSQSALPVWRSRVLQVSDKGSLIIDDQQRNTR